jgi:recombinational DNA repair protein RecR
MTRVCTICSHESRDAIEDAFIAGTPKRRIASHYGVSERAVRYHLREHLPALLALARDAERAARADTLLDRIEALQSRTLAILEATEEEGEHRTALAAIREARSNLELIGEVTKELNRAPTLNLSLHPEYVEARTLIVQALGPYPESSEAVVKALEGSGNGRG